MKYIIEGMTIDTGFKGLDYVEEYCPFCEGLTYNAPADRVSLCAHCGEVMFPCSGCDTNFCDWNGITQDCWRFSHNPPE